MGFKRKFVATVRFRLTLQRRISSYANSSHEIVVREYRNAISDMVISIVSLVYNENRPIFCTNGISVGRLPIIWRSGISITRSVSSIPETCDSFPLILMEFHRPSAANMVAFLLKIVQVRRLLISVRSLEGELSCDACHPVQASSTVGYMVCTVHPTGDWLHCHLLIPRACSLPASHLSKWLAIHGTASEYFYLDK